jgi:hypothetical protein
VRRCEARVDKTKLYAGDSGISFTQAILNRTFLNRRMDPPENKREGLVLRQTDKKEEYAALKHGYF